MTTIEPSVSRSGRAGGRRRGPTLPFVAAVGSPFDEWATTALPVIAPAVLDAATESFPVLTGPVRVPAPRTGVPALAGASRSTPSVR